MKKMKTVLIREPGKLDIVETDMPTVQKGSALLKIKYCGICGSDLATFTGNQPFATYPRIPGHEFSAEIVEIEENNRGLKAGMIVTANPYFNCGKCYSCERGLVNCCEHNETMGVQRDGAFSEYITMPIERIYDGKGLPADTLALIEPFSISYHAVKRGNIQAGDNVLVFGAGAIGLFALIAAKQRKANVYVVDMVDGRLAYAKKLGAAGVLNAAKEDTIAWVRKITRENGMDVCIEAVGSSKTFLNCIDCVAFGGKIVLIGNGKSETTLNQSIIVKKELNIFGSRNSLNDFEPLITMVKSDNVEVKALVSDVMELDKAQDAFDALACRDGSKMKILIKFIA
jgi:threonine dehydrogenase-like Zn-dependent dehydrogenase